MTKKTGFYKGKSNALGHGGRAQQLADQGVPKAVIGMIARSKGAAPGGPNYHGGVRMAYGGAVKSNITTNFITKNGLRCAYGGAINGPGGPREDKVPAMLSDGEYVLPAKTVDALGGSKYIDAIVQSTNDNIPPGGGLHRAGGGLFDRTRDLLQDSYNAARERIAPTVRAAAPYVEQAAQGVRSFGAAAADAVMPSAAPPVGGAPGIDVREASMQDFNRADPYSTDNVRARAAAARAATPPGYGGGPPAAPPAAPTAGGAGGAGRGATSLLRRGAGFLGKVVAPIAAYSSATDTAATPTDEYARRFGVNRPRYDNSLGDEARTFGLRGAGAASDFVNTLTGGALGNVFGFQGPPAAPTQSSTPAATAPTTAGQPDIRRALVDAGVDDPSRPPVPEAQRRDIMQGARPALGASINLGNYGGNADVYGSATRRGGRMDNFVAAAPGNGSGFDMRADVEGLARANAIRGSSLDAGANSPGVTIGQTDAFGHTPAERDAEMRGFRNDVADSRGGGFLPAGLRQQQLQRSAQAADLQRAHLGAATTMRGQDLDYLAARERNALTGRGQDLGYGEHQMSDVTTQRGQNLEFGARQQQVQLSIAQLMHTMGRENLASMDSEMKDHFNLTTKGGDTPENMARYSAARDRVLVGAADLKVDLHALSPRARTELYTMADRAGQSDADNQTWFRYLREKFGMGGPDPRSTSRHLRKYEPTGFNSGAMGDTVQTPTGRRSTDEIMYGRNSGPTGYMGPNALRDLDQTERLAPLIDEERRRRGVR